MNSKLKKAFSLVEVIIALSIFSFCCLGIIGLFSIALDATRSVSQESNASNIADSIGGFWQVAEFDSSTGNIFTMGNFTVGTTGNQTLFYNNFGTVVENQAEASLRLNYDVQESSDYPRTFFVNLTFYWPANAPEASPILNQRAYNYIFKK